MKNKKYYIIDTNCDCCSDRIARTNITWIYGPKCPGCGRILGCMQYSILGSVREKNHMEAIRLWNIGSEIYSSDARAKADYFSSGGSDF